MKKLQSAIPVAIAGIRPAAKRGFAIIISITLLAFLVLLLLSLVLLTRVGTQISANGLQDAVAKQNAFLALQMAIGQLEAYAGPDQRITLPAEFADTSPLANGSATVDFGAAALKNTASQVTIPNATAANLPPSASLQSGERFWTAVLANPNPAGAIFSVSPGYSGNSPAKVTGNLPPKVITYLVSGNEGIAGSPSYKMSQYGQLQSELTTFPFMPTMPVQGLTATSSYATTLTIGGVQAVLLVGINTASSSAELPNLADNFVVAPLVSISVSSQVLPGFSGTTPKLIGRYAWAILDEGVKAKVNLRDPYDGLNTLSGSATANINARVRMLAAQRSGVELVNGFADPADAAYSRGVTIGYPDNTASSTSNMLFDFQSLPQTRFLDNNATTVTTDAAIKQNFHNLTAYSYGVLADSQMGGLRKDLTALFEDPTRFKATLQGKNILPDTGEPPRNLATTYSATNNPMAMMSMVDPQLASITPVDPRNVSPKNYGPRWDLLNSYYNISTTGSGEIAQTGGTMTGGNFLTQTSSVTVQPGTLSQSPVIPVFTQMREYAKIQVTSGQLQILNQMVFVIGNPYSVTLSIPNGLEFLWLNPGYGTGWRAATGNDENDYGITISPGPSYPLAGSNGRATNGFPLMNLYMVGTASGGTGGQGTTSLSPNSVASNFGGLSGFTTTLAAYGTGPAADNQNPSVISSTTYYTNTLTLAPGQVQALVISGSGQVSNTNSPGQAQILLAPTGPSGVGSILDTLNNHMTYNTGVTISPSAATTYTITQPDGASHGVFMKDHKTHQVLQAVLNSDSANYDTEFTVNGVVYKFNLSGDSNDSGSVVSDTMTVNNGTITATANGSTNTALGGGLFLIADMPGSVVYMDTTTTPSLASATTWLTGLPGDGRNAFRMFAELNWAAKYRVAPLVQTGWGAITPPFQDMYLDNSTAGATGYQAFTSDTYPAIWGQDNTGVPMKVVVFDLPRRASLNEMPVLSIGQLQHANLTADDQYPFVGHQPGNAVGNSWFNPYETRTSVIMQRNNVYFQGNTNDPLSSSTYSNYYDISYLLNCALWDRYYFSAIPQTANSAVVSANPRLQMAAGFSPTAAQLALGKDIETPTADPIGELLPKESAAARYQMIDGAFNINSTSIEAWKAVLGGLRKRNATVNDTVGTNSASTAFPPTIYQPYLSTDNSPNGNGKDAATQDNAAAYGGFRRLTDAQITSLASCLVQEIRLRGPFPSLSAFINRGGITGFGYNTTVAVSTASNAAPVNLATQANTVQVEGALQMAIDRALINTAQMSGTSVADANFAGGPTGTGITSEIELNARPDNAQSNTNFADVLPAITITQSEVTGPGAGVSLNRATGIPGWLTQADVLQALGPALAARSDTFVIRAYGDSLDPINTVATNIQPANILGRAWCEAVVQRFPDYLDPTNPASVDPNGVSTSATIVNTTTISGLNQRFGRKFRVVAFRWLTPNDI